MLEGLISRTPQGEVLRVREVWEENLDDEMAIIRNVVDSYPFLAMDTEFPGAPALPVPARSSRHFRCSLRGCWIAATRPGARATMALTTPRCSKRSASPTPARRSSDLTSDQ